VVMQAAEAELLKKKGVIINVSSVSAVSESPVPGLVPYYVAKASQVGMHAACSGHKRCMQHQPGLAAADRGAASLY
jgi:NAD(P)-dependent dehydrogenase (short-subunit alcohol dehydrogenase family)